jgi:hypothetical protein
MVHLYNIVCRLSTPNSLELAIALQRNLDLSIPRKGTARPQTQFPHSCVCSDLYIHTIGPPIYLHAAEYADQWWEYINRTQKHECKNRDCGRGVPFMGIYVYNFRYSIFAVCL